MRAREVGTLTLLGLVLAALGIVTPILWDRYKSNTALEIRLVSSSVVVGDGPAIDKLQFSYDGRSVSQLSKLAFVLSNAGRIAIRSSDVVAPVLIRFGESSVLDVRIDAVTPEGLIVLPLLDSPNHTVSFDIPLLNPGDQIQFSILTESRDPQIQATARIAGLTTVVYVDQRGDTALSRKRIPWTVWVVGCFTALSLLCMLVGIHGAGEESSIKRILSSEIVPVPLGVKPQDYMTTLRSALPDYMKSDIKKVTTYLDTLPQHDVLDEQRAVKVRSLLRDSISSSNMIGAAVLFAVLSAIGVYYVARALY